MRNTMICLALACLLCAASLHRRCLAAEGPDLFEESWPAVSLPHRRVVLSSKVMELVQAIEVREGQRVRQGEVLIRLDARVLERQVDVAEKTADFAARIRSAQTKCEYLRREFERKSKLGEFVSESKLDEARTEVESAELDIQELQRQEELAKRNLEYYRARLQDYIITSPINGVVSSLPVETGEVVNEAQQVAEVIDPDIIEVRLHLPERNLVRIEDAQRVSAVFPAVSHARAFPGEIHFISPYVDGSSGTFTVKILVEASGSELRPGLACEVRFVEGSAEPTSPSPAPVQ